MDRIYSPQRRVRTAINTLAPNAVYDSQSDGTIIKWKSPDITQPSEADINAKVAEYATLWTAQEYARKRQAEYPSVGDQLDMLMKDMKNGTKTHQTACEAVKTKYPKG